MNNYDFLSLVKSENYKTEFFIKISTLSNLQKKKFLIELKEYDFTTYFKEQEQKSSERLYAKYRAFSLTRLNPIPKQPEIDTEFLIVQIFQRITELQAISKTILKIDYKYFKAGLGCNIPVKQLTGIHEALSDLGLLKCRLNEFRLIFLATLDYNPEIKWYGSQNELALLFAKLKKSGYSLDGKYSTNITKNRIFIVQKRIGKKRCDNEWIPVKDIRKKIFEMKSFSNINTNIYNDWHSDLRNSLNKLFS